MGMDVDRLDPLAVDHDLASAAVGMTMAMRGAGRRGCGGHRAMCEGYGSWNGGSAGNACRLHRSPLLRCRAYTGPMPVSLFVV
jgi:hypothetical protein